MTGKIGKKKCKILKEIRKAIADANDIQYVISECKYQGDCRGTCPKCEAEVRYLEKELEKRRASGKSVAIAGIATAMLLSAGCEIGENNSKNVTLTGDVMVSESSSGSELVDGEMHYTQTPGDVELSTEQESSESEAVVGEVYEAVDGQIYLPDPSSEDESSEEENTNSTTETFSQETESSEKSDEEYFSNALIPDDFVETEGEIYLPDEFSDSDNK